MAELDPNRSDPSTNLLLRGVGLAVIVATVIAGAAVAGYGVSYWQTHGGEPMTDATRRGDAGELRWRLAAVEAGNETQARTLLEQGNARGQHVDDAFVRVVAQPGASDRMLRLLLASDVSEAAKAAALEQAPPERAQLLLDLGVRQPAG
jgi:hypothetical protein